MRKEVQCLKRIGGKNMKEIRFKYPLYLFLIILLASSAVFYGCGGGGDNPPPPNFDGNLAGTYLLHQIGEDSNGIFTSQVEVTSNGDGTGSFVISRDSRGAPPAIPVPFTYSVAADGSFTVNVQGNTEHGFISADGRTFIMVDADTADGDNETVLAVAMKKDCTTPPTIIGNSYQGGQIGEENLTTTPVMVTARVDLTIQGGTVGGFTIVEHSGGATGAVGDFTYTANNDCSITVNNGVDDLYGIVSQDGESFVLVDTNPNGPPPADAIALFVAIKKSSGMGDWILSGDYQLGQAGETIMGTSLFYTSQVDVTADGNGSASGTINAHSLAPPNSLPVTPPPVTYSVNPAEGTFSTDNGQDIDYGIISSGGDLFMVVDADHNDADAEIIFAAGLKE